MFKIFSSLQKVLLDIVDLEHQLFEGMDFVLLTALQGQARALLPWRKNTQKLSNLPEVLWVPWPDSKGSVCLAGPETLGGYGPQPVLFADLFSHLKISPEFCILFP